METMRSSLLRLALLIPFISMAQSRAAITESTRKQVLNVLDQKSLAMDLAMAFEDEKIVGFLYGQARAAATLQFLKNRGIDPSLLEVRHNSHSQMEPYLVIPKFYDDGQDLYFFPSMNELTGRSQRPYALLSLYGRLDEVAHTASLLNDTNVKTELQKLYAMTDGAGPTDLTRFAGDYQSAGLTLSARLKRLLALCGIGKKS